MADKIYEFEGKYYSKTDHSEKVEDGKWGGDLFDLYFTASHGSLKDELCEDTVYYSAYDPEVVYESPVELVEDFFEDCGVNIGEIGGQMTNEELIEKYKKFILGAKETIEEYGNEYNMDDAKKDIEEYGLIVSALEKQIPKKPIINLWDEWCECPLCNGIVSFESVKYGYCPVCGQAIDWSVEND